MDQIRIAEVPWNEAKHVNLLVSEAFGYSHPHSYFDDFPIWTTKKAIRIGGYSGNELISHVGIQFRNLRTAGSRVPVALIGAVATKEAFRGRGYSSLLLKRALEIIDSQGCEWSLLWGSEHDFYSKFGFHLSGVQFRAPVSDLFLKDMTRSNTNQLRSAVHEGLCSRITDEFLTRKTGIEFNPDDIEWLTLQKTVKWFYINEPFAFIAYERGLDLGGMVHEIGGDPAGIRELLSHVLQLNPDAQVIGAPNELLRLGFNLDSCIQEYLCLGRPKDSSLPWNPEFWISGLSAV